MTRSARSLLLSTAALVSALTLAFGSVAAQDEDGMEEMASMEPVMEMEPGLHVIDAWARVSPMVDLAGAAYMTIHNDTDADDALVSASSPVAEFVELHLSSMDDEGMMSMNQVPEIPIPAHGDALLEPGGYHVMLINLAGPLEEGSEVELTLGFMTAEPQTISVPVSSEAPMAMGDGMDMGTDTDMEGDDAMGDDEAEVTES